ncbi:IS21 family transposase [Shewanella pneumatophori]|uniref:IS21 family transposase n=1 Tax=Shewanella pneumatophori TaxID=314092 RepID=A0A9X2CD96_9GAMM|nr:IS21 family transposase [Shewanella pneumatophori]MCL1137732.1 IS21 family transposase [Shewanella pneumatophori]
MLSKEINCLTARLLQTTNLSLRAVARATGCSHVSVHSLKKKMQENQLTWQQMQVMDETELTAILHPKWPCRNVNKVEPDWEKVIAYISQPKQTILNAYHEYVKHCEPARAYKYTRFCEMLRAVQRKNKLAMRQLRKAGEVAIVDYAGTKIPYGLRDAKERKFASIFVSVLGASIRLFGYATNGQTTKDWIEAHEKMFEFYGGVSEIVIPDNPKALVVRSNPEKVLNANYESFGNHYGVTILPARPGKPKDKGVTESAVGFVTSRILARMLKMEFETIDEINEYLSKEIDKLNEAPFQKLKTSRQKLLDEVDKPVLRPLPKTPFALIEKVFNMTVPSDYSLLIDDHYYSVPHKLAHKKVIVHLTSKFVEVFHQGAAVARHKRCEVIGEITRDYEHMPPNHQYMEDKDLEFYWDWASDFGENTQQLVAIQFDGKSKKSRLANDRCRKIMKFAEKSEISASDFERACQFALKYQQISPTRLNAIIQAKAYRIDDGAPKSIPNMPATDKYLRGSDYFVFK